MKWLPRSVRGARGLTSGAVTGSYILGSVAATLAVPPLLVAWKAFALGGFGVYLAGDQAGRRLMRRRLARLAAGEVPLAELSREDDGTLLIVRGQIEASDPLTGLLRKTPGVFRRMRLLKGRWIHEAAVDFVLVSDEGKRVPVQCSGARWLMSFPEDIDYPQSRFQEERIPEKLQELTRRFHHTVAASEQVLQVGARVQIVGYKGVVADPTGEVRDYRTAPQRAVIRSGPALPLVISLIE